jgi:hypothetical protein
MVTLPAVESTVEVHIAQDTIVDGGLQHGSSRLVTCPAVESVVGRLSGASVFRDTRMPVSAVFENLEAPQSPLQFPRSMLILFDHGTPRGIARFLSDHTVTKAKVRGWDTLTNGDLLPEAERARCEVLLTADKNMRYQHNLAGRRIAIVVLSNSAMALRSIAHGKNCGGGERSHAIVTCRLQVHKVRIPVF